MRVKVHSECVRALPVATKARSHSSTMHPGTEPPPSRPGPRRSSLHAAGSNRARSTHLAPRHQAPTSRRSQWPSTSTACGNCFEVAWEPSNGTVRPAKRRSLSSSSPESGRHRPTPQSLHQRIQRSHHSALHHRRPHGTASTCTSKA